MRNLSAGCRQSYWATALSSMLNLTHQLVKTGISGTTTCLSTPPNWQSEHNSLCNNVWIASSGQMKNETPVVRSDSIQWCTVVGGLVCMLPHSSPQLDNVQVMVIVWRLRGNIIRTAVCWTVWHSVQSAALIWAVLRGSNRLGLSHWDPYGEHRGSCIEL